MVTVLLLLTDNGTITINHETLCELQFIVCNFLPIATVLRYMLCLLLLSNRIHSIAWIHVLGHLVLTMMSHVFSSGWKL